jgi:tetratricopeptide (TPR) repeat protein
MRRFRIYPAALAILALGVVSGCANIQKLTYEKEELKNRVEAEAPTLSLNDIEIPFEVTREQVTLARKYTKYAHNDLARAEKLIDAIMNPKKIGVEYADMVTGTAAETLKAKKGNCLSIASVFVGLARGIGLRAHYMEASVSPLEVFASDDFVVNSGHVTAIVETENGTAALDFGEQLGTFIFFRKMSDVEATAHFYNNRGFEIIHQAMRNKKAVDWKEAAENFNIATRLKPDFDPAWNNLGLAYANLGRYKDATKCYRTAISKNPESAAAHSNMGNLQLSLGDLDTAIKSFNKAAKLDPDSPHVHYRLGIALRKKGELYRAAGELEQTLTLRNGYSKACKELGQVYRQLGRKYPSKCADVADIPTYYSKSKIFHM